MIAVLAAASASIQAYSKTKIDWYGKAFHGCGNVHGEAIRLPSKHG